MPKPSKALRSGMVNLNPEEPKVKKQKKKPKESHYYIQCPECGYYILKSGRAKEECRECHLII